MRLIDFDALIPSEEHTIVVRRADGTGVWASAEQITNAPTVDAVEVVRCKDCVYCKRFNDVWHLPKKDELLCTLYVETYHTTENDFCSRGERREDGKID